MNVARSPLVDILARVHADLTPVTEGAVATYIPELALLECVTEEFDGVDSHFAAAVEQSERLGSPVWAARSLLDWAEYLLEAGETDRARELGARANAAMDGLTLPALADQSAALHARL